MIAEQINRTDHGRLKDVNFTDQELEEIRLAAWLHDIGKIITPEYIADKSTKLETIYDRGAEVDLRMMYIEKSLEFEYLREKFARMERGETDFTDLDKAWKEKYESLENDRLFLRACNMPTFEFTQVHEKRLEAIGKKTYMHDGEVRPYLSEEELNNLRVPRGTLTPEERNIMRNHATVTYKMLSSLPFPKDLKRVPDFAAQHHERLDGSGYPFGLTSPMLSLQARIMAVADIFEALTASDRPYKDAAPLSTAIDLLREHKDNGHIDPDVHDLLVESGLISAYAQQELSRDQIDIPLDTEFILHKEDRVSNRLMRLMGAHPKEEPPSGARRVLVVDDSVNNRMLVSYYVEDSPFEVDVAGNALEALSFLIKKSHQAVMLDLEMPQLDGYTLASTIRQWERRHGLENRFLIAIAAPFQALDKNRLERSGFTHTIKRPFDKKTLLRFLQSFFPSVTL